MLQKRYQYFGPNGEILWTKWFSCISTKQEKIQLKGRIILKNEYRKYGNIPNTQSSNNIHCRLSRKQTVVS